MTHKRHFSSKKATCGTKNVADAAVRDARCTWPWSWSCLSVALDQVFVCRQLTQRHRAAGVEFLGADADLGPETELGTVGECRRDIDIYACRIYVLHVEVRGLGVLGDDGLAVFRRITGDMLHSLTYGIYRPDRHLVVEELGAEAPVGGRGYFAGNLAMVHEEGIGIPGGMLSEAGKWESEAKTVIWFADCSSVLAVLAVEDVLKPTSEEAVRQLRDMGIEVWMLTGDNGNSARAVAAKAGIGRYRSDVLPEDKTEFIKRLQSEGHKVAMAGDGINDSAALARADLSIAMGQGSDIAMDAAMMTVLSSDLLKIPQAIRLSSMTVKTIRENLFWAFFYNIIAVPIAAGVLYPVNGFLLDPMIGGAAMAMSSVSVVSNSLRLRYKKTGSIGHAGYAGATDMDKNSNIMKKFKVEGMMCGHCRAHVEKALNSIEGVQATVSLDPPVAEVEFTEGRELTLQELQKAVTENAGEYTLTQM